MNHHQGLRRGGRRQHHRGHDPDDDPYDGVTVATTHPDVRDVCRRIRTGDESLERNGSTSRLRWSLSTRDELDHVTRALQDAAAAAADADADAAGDGHPCLRRRHPLKHLEVSLSCLARMGGHGNTNEEDDIHPPTSTTTTTRDNNARTRSLDAFLSTVLRRPRQRATTQDNDDDDDDDKDRFYPLQIECLTLYHVTDEIVERVCAHVSDPGCRLRELRLMGGTYHDRTASALARALRTNRRLETLLVSDGHIGDAGCDELCRVALHYHNTTLRHLKLINQCITDQGARSFQECFELYNYTLRTLLLTGNHKVSRCISNQIAALLFENHRVYTQFHNPSASSSLSRTRSSSTQPSSSSPSLPAFVASTMLIKHNRGGNGNDNDCKDGCARVVPRYRYTTGAALLPARRCSLPSSSLPESTWKRLSVLVEHRPELMYDTIRTNPILWIQRVKEITATKMEHDDIDDDDDDDDRFDNRQRHEEEKLRPTKHTTTAAGVGHKHKHSDSSDASILPLSPLPKHAHTMTKAAAAASALVPDADDTSVSDHEDDDHDDDDSMFDSLYYDSYGGGNEYHSTVMMIPFR